MSLLSRVQKGKSQQPPRLLLYGTEGIGKSTFAAGAPKPIFIQTEDGLGEIDCEKFPLATSYRDVVGALAELRSGDHEYETVVLDSLDWLERMIWDHVCERFGCDNIEKVDGGYSKGYVHALTEWREVLRLLDGLRSQRGMVTILLAHAKVEKFEDPESAPYDRYSPRLHKHASHLVREWCDAVLFASVRVRTQTSDAGFGRKRTIATAVGRDGGERVIRPVGGPACVAKNRFGLTGDLPLSWAHFVGALSSPATQQGV